MNIKGLMAVLVLGIAGIALAACEDGNTIVNTPGSTMGISVSATGEAFGSPDVMNLRLGVQAEAPDVAAARETAAASAQAVIDSVKGNGVDDKDVRTTQFNVEPLYDFSRGGTQAIRGYRVTNVVTVDVREIENASKVIDDAIAAGGDNTLVQSISFTIDDPAELEQAARSDAMRQAREKAERLAQDAGVSAGEPISITEGGGFTPFDSGIVAPRTGAAVDTATPIETGQLEVNISVTVLYAIE